MLLFEPGSLYRWRITSSVDNFSIADNVEHSKFNKSHLVSFDTEYNKKELGHMLILEVAAVTPCSAVPNDTDLIIAVSL